MLQRQRGLKERRVQQEQRELQLREPQRQEPRGRLQVRVRLHHRVRFRTVKENIRRIVLDRIACIHKQRVLRPVPVDCRLR